MADVTTSFAAKDAGFTAVMQRLEARLTGFSKKMNRVAASSKKLQSGFSGLTKNVLGLAAAYVGVSQAVSAFNKAMDLGGKMSDLASVTGSSAGELAVLERAFTNTDIGGEKMLPMLSKMTEFIQQLRLGSKNAIDTAQTLGVTFEQLKSQSPIQQFQTLIHAMAGLSTEGKRLEASGDIFGTRGGGKLLVLANNFAAEMGTARKQLGSVVDILDRSADRIDNLGDTLRNSVGNKFSDFALGILDGARGANELVTALSEIDTAAAGIKLGQIFAGAVQEPHKAFLLMGELMLLAVRKAGNELINATSYAAAVWTKALSDRTTFGGLMDGLLAGFQMIFNFAANASLKIIKLLVQAVSGLASVIPVIGKSVGRSIAAPLGEIEGQEARINEQAGALRKRMVDAMFGTAADVAKAAQSLPRKDVDVLGVADQQAQVDALKASLTPPTPPITIARPDQQAADKFFKELNETYRMKVDEIHAMTSDRNEQLRRLEVLRGQYKERAMQGVAVSGYPSPDLMTPEQQMKDNSLPQKERDSMQPSSSDSENKSAASEPTLKKAVDLLSELNQKLPQTALV